VSGPTGCKLKDVLGQRQPGYWLAGLGMPVVPEMKATEDEVRGDLSVFLRAIGLLTIRILKAPAIPPPENPD